MKQLSDTLLIASYRKAYHLELDRQFIELLKEEITARGLEHCLDDLELYSK